jgi:putative transposase
MRDYKCWAHTRWDYKYHIVFISKKRRKIIFGTLRKHLGEIFHELAQQKGVVIEEGHLMNVHVHMCLSIPPRLSV